MFNLCRSALLALASATLARAHMQLFDPIALGDPRLPNIQAPDYNMKSPLSGATGTLGSYPCRGHLNDGEPFTSQKSVAAGSTFTYTISGTVTHLGGSCQVVLSYDQGVTWSVIYSHIGGCVVEGLTETITIPKDAPSGDVLFGWNWFNHAGNREMYQNCAVITITGGGAGLTDQTKYPPPFIANAGINQCATVEGIDIVFPKPGAQVVYGGTYKGTTPTSGAGITGTNCEGAVSSGTSSNTTTTGSATAPDTSGSASASVPAGPADTSASSSAPGAATVSSSPASGSGSSLPAVAAVSDSATTSTGASPATATSPAQTKACKRKRSRSLSADVHGNVERRHERLVRKGTGRVAALPAEHITHA